MRVRCLKFEAATICEYSRTGRRRVFSSPCRGDDGQREEVERIFLEQVLRQHDLGFVAQGGIVFREKPANGLVAARIAAKAIQHRRDHLQHRLNAKMPGDQPSQLLALGVGILFRQQQRGHIFGAKGADAQRQDDR